MTTSTKELENNGSLQATLYDQISTIQKEGGQTLVPLSTVKKGNRVLDLGCGTGYFAAILSELVGPEGRIVAVDSDAERIKLAKEKNARDNIEYVIGNDQTFPEDHYDVVFSNHVIPRVKNKVETFKRIQQNLHTEGRFAFLTLDGSPTFPPTMSKALNELIGPNFIHTLVYEQQHFEVESKYHELAKSAGLKVVHSETEATCEKWESLDDFLSYFHSISHGEFSMSLINQEALKRFKEDYEEALISESAPRTLLYMVLKKSRND